jgi:hypothetical protein
MKTLITLSFLFFSSSLFAGLTIQANTQQESLSIKRPTILNSEINNEIFGDANKGPWLSITGSISNELTFYISQEDALKNGYSLASLQSLINDSIGNDQLEVIIDGNQPKWLNISSRKLAISPSVKVIKTAR